MYVWCECGYLNASATHNVKIQWNRPVWHAHYHIFRATKFHSVHNNKGKKRSLEWKKCLKSNKNKKPKNTRLLTCVDFIYYYDYYFFVVCLMYFMLGFFIVWYRHSADTLHILRYSYFAFEPLDSRCRLAIPLCSWTKQFAHRNYIIM